MPIEPQNGSLTAGVAGQYSDTISPEAEALLTGDTPAVFATEETVASGRNLPAHQVVAYDGSNRLIPAVHGTSGAIGVLVYAVDASSAAAPGEVFRGGCFNPDELVWDPSFDTDEKKKAAFNGAPSPTQIVIRRITTLVV